MKNLFLINLTKTLLFFFSFSLLLFILFLFSFPSYYFANAQEEIITIVPGSSDSSRYRFFDITEYPISTEEEIKWYNADDVIHNIVIFSNNGKDILTKSENIKPKGFFSYTFENKGEYLFQSSNYDWMKGKIIVTDDIETIKKSMEKDIDIYLSWTPSSINIGEKVFFKIIFVDNKSEKNQEHLDYSFTIENPTTSDNTLYKNAITHSAWGVEPASHTFNSNGVFIGKVGIEGLLFQPIEPVFTEFELQVVK
jgi:plastocyanin